MKGIRAPFLGRRGVRKHASHAIREKSPLAQDTPLPGATKRASGFFRDSRPRDIAAFRGQQLARLSDLIAELSSRHAT